MRRGYTLIEIIITVTIMGILSIGMFKAMQALTLRSEKAKALSALSIDSQSALDQISILLYNRVPKSVVGFNANEMPPYPSLESVSGKTILQWYGTASESYDAGEYSCFVDMNRSNFASHTLYSPETNLSAVLRTEQIKWNDPAFDLSKIALIFPSSTLNEYEVTASPANAITFATAVPDTIYEKYSLVDSAYAITRKADVASCSLDPAYDGNTLLLFYNYRPWKGESFCDGNVTVLATGVNAFRAQMLNGTIRLAIDVNRSIRGSSAPVRLSKQKVVF